LSFPDELSKIRKYSEIGEDFPKMRLLGGMDGFAAHCDTDKESDCIINMEKMKKEKLYYLANGYLTLVSDELN